MCTPTEIASQTSTVLPSFYKYIGRVTTLDYIHNDMSFASSSPPKDVLYSTNAAQRMISHLLSYRSVLKLQFCHVSSLAKHRARLDKQTDKLVSNRGGPRKVSCAHRQLHCHPLQGPSPPASRPLRQAAAAAPRACDPQNQDNVDTSYRRRRALVSPTKRPTTKAILPPIDTNRKWLPVCRRSCPPCILPEASDVFHL